MLNGLYGYLFGGEEVMDNQENEMPSVSKRVEDDWYLVEEGCSGRSSPVLVPHPDIQDIDTLSLRSEKNSTTRAPSPGEVKRAEALRKAKAVAAQRAALENALFTEVPTPVCVSTTSRLTSKSGMSASRMKRASATAHSDLKAKPRSKKTGKLSSGMNNDRKVNNLN